MKKIWLTVILGSLSLAACGCGYYSGGYYATTAPPPIRAEVRGYAPGPGYVWVDGYWGYRSNRYAWNSGYWARPPRARAVWVPGRWEHRGNRYYYREGR